MSKFLNHKFYTKGKKEQNKTLFLISIGSLTIIILSIIVSILTGLFLIPVIAIPVTLSIIAPFLDMPSLKSSGRIIYFSPLFIAEQPREGTIHVHGGTLFDYVFVIDRALNGRQRTEFILQQYLSGLLNLMEKYKDEKQLKIRGTSYIINERTAQKLGFKTVPTNLFQRFILGYNYFNILISNSIAKNKVSFPKLSNTKTFEAKIIYLLERKPM